jgi:GNAT superfamily N-acetyltransferase
MPDMHPAGRTAPEDSDTVMIRQHKVGDMGWIIHRQALLYAAEYGWDVTFEGMIAAIAGQFIEGFDPDRERCFVAERHGVVIGSAFLVKDTDDTAKIRMVYVESSARGLGLGRRLVGDCIAFAKAAGYRRITLWTNDILHAARKIYEAEGFVLVEEESHVSFGKSLVGQNWALNLPT